MTGRAADPRRRDRPGATLRGATFGLVARGAPFIVVGEAIPLLAAVAAMPVIVARLGADRLGLLQLAWALIGYFSLFDLGLGRAMTRLVASRIADGRDREVPRLVVTALAVLAALGVAGGALLAALAPWLADRALRVPESLQGEARTTFLVLAATVPLVVVTSGLRGVLEAWQRFATLSAVRAGLGLVSFLGPLAVLPFSSSLVPVVLVLAAGRVAALALHVVLCRRALLGRGERPALERDAFPEMLRFGGWLTVTNLVSPLLVLLDRFVVGALVSVEAVAYYATPLEVVQRVVVIPVAIGTVLFPAMAATSAGEPGRRRDLLSAGLRLSLVAVFPVLLILSIWAHDGLRLWLGPEFASQATSVVRWVALGLLVNALGSQSLFFLQAIGRPDIGAKLHLAELAAYVPLLWWLASRRGIEGAAIAWTLRVGVDAALLLVAASTQLSHAAAVPGAAVPRGPRPGLRIATMAGVGLAALAVAPQVDGLAAKLAASLAVTGAYLAACFALLLTADERQRLGRLLGRA